MAEDKLDIRHFNKTQLMNTLERLYLGHSISSLDEALDIQSKTELVMDYLAIKQLIQDSEAR